MDEANGLLPNDTLTLFCEVRLYEIALQCHFSIIIDIEFRSLTDVDVDVRYCEVTSLRNL